MRGTFWKTKPVAQAAVEYLVTYGWAIVLIATVAAILFGTLNVPKGYACSGFSEIICKAANATGEDLFLTMQNSTASDIIINPFTGIAFDGKTGYGIIIYQGKEYRLEDVIIKSGDSFQIKGLGQITAASAAITYYETRTGYTKTSTTNTTGQNPEHIEISNNGIDDDGDGKTDCLDSKITSCTYVLEPADIPIVPAVLPAGGAFEMYTFLIDQLGSAVRGDRYDLQILQLEMVFFVTNNPASAPIYGSVTKTPSPPLSSDPIKNMSWIWQLNIPGVKNGPNSISVAGGSNPTLGNIHFNLANQSSSDDIDIDVGSKKPRLLLTVSGNTGTT